MSADPVVTLPVEPSPGGAGTSSLPRNRARLVLLVLFGLALACCVAYVTTDVVGSWAFVLPRRVLTVTTMTVVGIAIAISTVVFHTITGNQILTPSIMGFDALYLLIQTLFVFTLGTGALFAADPVLMFLAQAAIMTVLATSLYRAVLLDLGRSLHVVLLVGIVLGGLFRSLAGFLQRVMDPTQFIVLQDRFFADFTGADPTLLCLGALTVIVLGARIWRTRATLDVMALGRDVAINLGVNHRATVMTNLVVITLLVSVSTALVGPSSFFGLLVAHLAYRLLGTHRHAVTLPGAAAAAVVCLVGGQLLFERLLGFEGSLSMVVEFLGGIVFIALLIGRVRR